MAGKKRGPGGAGGEVQVAARGLPDCATLTLAEAVSWTAWGQPFSCDAFQGALHRNRAARSALRRAAHVPRYGAADFRFSLQRAWHRLCNLAAAGEITVHGKRNPHDAGFLPIPCQWFWPDPRPPEAILHEDALVKLELEPLERLLKRDDVSLSEWVVVRFECAALALHAAALRETTASDPPPERKPHGVSYRAADASLLLKMHDAIVARHARNPTDAAQLVVGEAVGRGSVRSKVERLAAGYRKHHMKPE